MAAKAAWLALLACGPPTSEAPEQVSVRFVERLDELEIEPPHLSTAAASAFPAHPGSAASVPTSSILDDRRPVLARHPRQLVAQELEIGRDASGRAELELSLPAGFEPGERLLLEAELIAAKGAHASRLAPIVTTARRSERGLTASWPGSLEPRHRGRRVKIWAARPVPSLSLQTPAAPVPERASLEFAIGIEAAGAGAAPVLFAVERCVESECDRIYEESRRPPSDGGPAPWQDRRVELHGTGGSTASFRFLTVSDPAAAVLPLFADPRIVTRAEPQGRRPSLLLISLDTLRADHLDLYGYRRETAPFLSSWATSRGTVVEHAVAEAATTDSSHMTLFTGLPTRVHGVAGFQRPIAIAVPTLAGLLWEQGFETAAFTENGPLAGQRGFAIGFGRYVENKSDHLLQPLGQVDRTLGQGRAWLERFGDRRFFLFLHTFQVHAPYAPAPEEAALFRERHTRETAQRLRNAYDAEIRMVDNALSELLGWMAERGLLEHTVVAILSDHGEEFQEHGSQGHATLPYETVLRVPLILAGPGVPAGRRIEGPAHHVDVLPTLLELLEVDPEIDGPGRSLVPWLRGTEPREEAPRPLFSASWALPRGIARPAVAVQLGSRKLIRYREEGRIHRLYFDLASDPDEEHGRAPRSGEADDLEALLDRHALESKARRDRLRAESPAVPETPASVLDARQRQKLRALGYIE